MRIEPGQHAIDRSFDQLAVVGFFHVVGANALEYISEQIELPVSISGPCRLRAHASDNRSRLNGEQSLVIGLDFERQLLPCLIGRTD